MMEFARLGAKHRYEQLKTEMNDLLRAFPGLTSGASPNTGRQEQPARPTRRRRKLSAAARKAISNAQKARWAKQKATAADSARGSAIVANETVTKEVSGRKDTAARKKAAARKKR